MNQKFSQLYFIRNYTFIELHIMKVTFNLNLLILGINIVFSVINLILFFYFNKQSNYKMRI